MSISMMRYFRKRVALGFCESEAFEQLENDRHVCKVKILKRMKGFEKDQVMRREASSTPRG